MNNRESGKKSLWQPTPVANLIRYVPSGIYFARARVRGKLIRKSLKTTKLSVAQLRLNDLLKEERRRAEAQATSTDGKMTFSQALAKYRHRLEGDHSLKPRSKVYRNERIAALLKSWPELEKLDVRKITKADCLDWAAGFGKQSSAITFNNTVGTLRLILDLAVEAGARYDNPARFIKRARVRQKELHLPSNEQFEALVKEIEAVRVGPTRRCADLVRFLAFGGFRKSEAANIRWSDCDFAKGEIVVRGDENTGRKNWSVIRVPMIPEMRQLLQRLRAQRQDAQPTDPVMLVRECQGALNRACKKLGIPRITHHDLRRLFATRCIESGVDIPTVSRWLGHKDGGALAMKTYGHLRDHHSVSMAQKVSFSTNVPTNVEKLPVEKVA
jgi:integrase